LPVLKIVLEFINRALSANPICPFTKFTVVALTGSTLTLNELGNAKFPITTGITFASSKFVAVIPPPLASVNTPGPVCKLDPPLLPPCASNVKLPIVSLKPIKFHAPPPRILTAPVSAT
jgi:hypothetical protein